MYRARIHAGTDCGNNQNNGSVYKSHYQKVGGCCEQDLCADA